MRDINMNKFVCTDLDNERGFTFSEMLLTIMIISITMPIIVYLFQLIQVDTDETDLAMMQFFIYLRDDVLRAESVSVTENEMYFQLTTGETVKIERYNDLIRRQVDGKGHEIYARDVKKFHLKRLSYGTKVSITTTEGKTYEKIIAHD